MLICVVFSLQSSLRIAQLADATSLVMLKLEFMRVVCSHEHFITLNLPFGTPLTPSAPSSPTPSVASSTSQVSCSTINPHDVGKDMRIVHLIIFSYVNS